MDDLEKKVEKVDWKQWLPMAGPYFAVRDAFRGKPHIMDDKHKLRLYFSALYHGAVSAYPVYLGVCDLVNR